MAVGIERRARKVASRFDQPPDIRPHFNSGMSYNPLGYSSGISMPTPPGPVQNTTEAADANLASQPTAPPSHSQSSKKRRPSKGKVPSEIRRSASTPHMRNLALGNSGELSPTAADKRRNKLGYHRTSVACGKATSFSDFIYGYGRPSASRD
jgi:hypothetical protein